MNCPLQMRISPQLQHVALSHNNAVANLPSSLQLVASSSIAERRRQFEALLWLEQPQEERFSSRRWASVAVRSWGCWISPHGLSSQLRDAVVHNKGHFDPRRGEQQAQKGGHVLKRVGSAASRWATEFPKVLRSGVRIQVDLTELELLHSDDHGGDRLEPSSCQRVSNLYARRRCGRSSTA